MGSYDARRVMLDSGLTVLALRGLREREGHYPFVERLTNRHRARSRRTIGGATRPASRWRRALQRWGLGHPSGTPAWPTEPIPYLMGAPTVAPSWTDPVGRFSEAPATLRTGSASRRWVHSPGKRVHRGSTRRLESYRQAWSQGSGKSERKSTRSTLARLMLRGFGKGPARVHAR
jgi:hypothetical protein